MRKIPNDDSHYGLRVIALRGGTVTEFVQFLQDIELCHDSLYRFHSAMERRLTRMPFWNDLGIPYARLIEFHSVPPEDRITVRRVIIESPGFWEFLGNLNPLQQIREYLNDRHKRRQDREYREKNESERLALENRMIETQILERESSLVRVNLKFLIDELGVSRKQIRALIWDQVGRALVSLGKHQDTGLIESADLVTEDIRR